MAISIFGETGGEIVEVLIKLAPAATIVGAIIAARLQFKNARKLNQEVIAKNHYREMIILFMQNADIYFRGLTDDGLTELKKDPAAYRKYRLLFNSMSFVLQELYLSIDPIKERHWANVCSAYLLMFKPFAASSDDTPDYMWKCLDPRFAAFFKRVIAQEDHFFTNRPEADLLVRGT